MGRTDKEPVIVVLNDWGSVGAALESNGAITVETDDIKELATLLKYADAMVLTGGADIDPDRYGAESHWQTGGHNLRRDKLEFAAVRIARKHRLPMMGICRGHQLLNVAYGGTLIQHIPDQKHAMRHDGSDHFVYMREDSQIGKGMGVRGIPSATSLHHQAVENMGEGLVPVGWAFDGTVEMFESTPGTKPYVLGTQFHPEMDWRSSLEANDIFRYFVQRVQERALGRGKFARRKEKILEITSQHLKKRYFSDNSSYGQYGHGWSLSIDKQTGGSSRWDSRAGDYRAYHGVAWDDDMPRWATPHKDDPITEQWMDDWALMDGWSDDAKKMTEQEKRDEEFEEWKHWNQYYSQANKVLDELDARCMFPPCRDPNSCTHYGDCAAEAAAMQTAHKHGEEAK